MPQQNRNQRLVDRLVYTAAAQTRRCNRRRSSRTGKQHLARHRTPKRRIIRGILCSNVPASAICFPIAAASRTMAAAASGKRFGSAGLCLRQLMHEGAARSARRNVRQACANRASDSPDSSAASHHHEHPPTQPSCGSRARRTPSNHEHPSEVSHLQAPLSHPGESRDTSIAKLSGTASPSRRTGSCAGLVTAMAVLDAAGSAAPKRDMFSAGGGSGSTISSEGFSGSLLGNRPRILKDRNRQSARAIRLRINHACLIPAASQSRWLSA